MRIRSIGSGSKGNGTLVQSAKTTLLVDCGFGLKDSTKRLESAGVKLEDIDAILLTHEHGDHAKGIELLSRHGNIPVYLSSGTQQVLKQKNLINQDTQCELINPNCSFNIGDIEIKPVAVPHDAREACQFVFRSGDICFGLLTDVGSITSHMLDHYNRCDILLLEFNHDRQMLSQGPYPASLKSRVAGSHGHLNNDQALQFLEQVNGEHLKKVIIAHISETNNDPAKVREMIQQSVNLEEEQLNAWLIFAEQQNGTDWVSL